MTKRMWVAYFNLLSSNLKGLKKTMKASVTIAGDGVKIYTQNFSNINGNHDLVTFSQ